MVEGKDPASQEAISFAYSLATYGRLWGGGSSPCQGLAVGWHPSLTQPRGCLLGDPKSQRVAPNPAFQISPRDYISSDTLPPPSPPTQGGAVRALQRVQLRLRAMGTAQARRMRGALRRSGYSLAEAARKADPGRVGGRRIRA